MSNRSRNLLIITVVVSLLHHTDHVLRVDHSGWPFTPDVNEFTLSWVLAYGVSAFVLFVPGWLWAKFWIMLGAYVATQAAHTFVETPGYQYNTWAVASEVNMLGVQSPVLGWIAVVVSLLLSVMLVSTTVSLFRDARTQGRRPKAGSA